jgi:ABC-type oligopeptide transport system substrate-binding subunit
MQQGSGSFCNLLDQAITASTHEDMQKYTTMAVNEIIHQQVLFIPIATISNLVAAKPNVVIPKLHPTLLTTHWADIQRH